MKNQNKETVRWTENHTGVLFIILEICICQMYFAQNLKNLTQRKEKAKVGDKAISCVSPG